MPMAGSAHSGPIIRSVSADPLHTASAELLSCREMTRWVRLDKTHIEHNESALTPIADMEADVDFLSFWAKSRHRALSRIGC